MDPLHAAFRRSQRPVCRLWQRGNCTLSSIQCEFRHAEVDSQAGPSLGEAFAPQQRIPDSRWMSRGEQARREPLQELVFPASSTSIWKMDDPRVVLHPSAWDVEADREWNPEWDDFEELQARVDDRMFMDLDSNALACRFDSCLPQMPNASGPDAFDVQIWEDGQDTDIVMYECNDGAASPDQDSSNKENDYLEVMLERETQQRSRRTDATRESSPDHPPSTLPSTITEHFDMSQSRDFSQDGHAPHNNGVGPHPSFIQVANPYIFEQNLQGCLTALGATEHKEDSIRLQGVHYIDSVRKALQLPIRTFNTAVVYYHKFRLVHADNEYMFSDAAAAALFTACKIEDTLKKSREVLCAAWNLRLPSSDHLSPDDPVFEQPSKTVVGLERLMLESAGFDFRNRHPQEIVLKLVKDLNLPKETIGRLAYNMSIDIYRTFAPLKQTAQTMAIACVELAARLLNLTANFDLDSIVGPQGISLEKWSTTRAEIMETLLDLLDLFTHHRNATIVGGHFSIDNFITARISLNKEASSQNLARYAEWIDAPKSVLNGATNGSKKTPQSPAVTTSNPSPNSPPAMGPTSATGAKSRVGERGKDGTVRFMLSAERARGEKDAVAKFFAPDEWERYEEEVDVPINS